MHLLSVLSKNHSLHSRRMFFFLTLLVGLFIIAPTVNYQGWLATGDHGRELYGYKKTLEGAMPYRDYSWLFGPLMPYYYSQFFRLFGVSIQSILLGQSLLILVTGILIYLTCVLFLSPASSFICALWYWAFRGVEFFYAYNHSGGIVMLMLSVYFIFRYIKETKLRDVFIGFVCIFLLMLIRLNIGLATLIGFVFLLLITDIANKDPLRLKKRFLYFGSFVIIISLATFVYWLLLHSLPKYAIYQSLPYKASYRLGANDIPLTTLPYLCKTILFNFTATFPRKVFGLIFVFSCAQLFFLIWRNKLHERSKIPIILALISLFVLISLNLHEFILSGMFYRLKWIFPLVLIFLFFPIDISARSVSSPFTKNLVLVLLFLIPFLQIKDLRRTIQSDKIPEHELKIGKNHIYTSQPQEWFNTVIDVTNFIQQKVPLKEKILVLPFDPLYYFLSRHDSITRQLDFFESTHISPEQEKEIISRMEKEKCHYIILSNRSESLEPGAGVFGMTHCLLLAKYIEERFELVATFGDWQKPGGWAWDHAVLIYKKREGVLDGLAQKKSHL